jgi:hypothetical protein
MSLPSVTSSRENGSFAFDLCVQCKARDPGQVHIDAAGLGTWGNGARVPFKVTAVAGHTDEPINLGPPL